VDEAAEPLSASPRTPAAASAKLAHAKIWIRLINHGLTFRC
jgi:hypothetical protein